MPAACVGTEETGKVSGLGRPSQGRLPEDVGASLENQVAMQRCGWPRRTCRTGDRFKRVMHDEVNRRGAGKGTGAG